MSFPDGRLRLGGGARIVALSTSDLGATAGEIGSGAAPVRTLSTQRRPASCATIYLDPDRDYQRGLQRESRPRHGVERLAEAPVVAGASAARAVACRMLRDGEAAAETLELSLPFRWLAVSVGDILDIESVSGRWRVVRREVEQLIVRLLCERVAPGTPLTNRLGDGGRALPSPLVPPAPTSLLAFEPPADLLDQGAAPGVSVVATGGTGWRGARVTAIRVDGWVETPLGDVRDGCWFGSLVEPAAAGPREYWDEKTELVIASDGDDDGPLGRPDAAVLSGANLLLVGEELVQFRDAVALGRGQFRLRGLLRGRYATRIPSSGHPAGTRVCRIEPPSLMRLPVRAEEAGAALLLVADGVGDPPDGARAEHRVSAAGSAPFAPCHLSARREADGLIVVQWISRHRGEMAWGSIPRAIPADTVFECRLRSGPNSMTRLVLGEQLVLSAQDQVAGFGSLPDTLVIQVTAVGEGPDWLRSSDEVLVLL